MSTILRTMRGGFLGLLIIFASCSEKNATSGAQKVPLAGMDTLPQLLILKDATLSASKSWAEPDENSFTADFPAHLTVERVSSEAEAIEKFNIYNGRSVDFMFLGQGLPQKIYSQLKLPRNPKRLVFALNPERKMDEVLALDFSMPLLRKWLEDFCAQKFLTRPCEWQPREAFPDVKGLNKSTQPGFLLALDSRKLDADSSGRPVLLSVFIDWDAFYRKQLLDLRARAGQSLDAQAGPFDVSATFLRIENGDALKTFDPKIVESIDNFKKSSILRFLGMGSTQQKSPVSLDLIRRSAPPKDEGAAK